MGATLLNALATNMQPIDGMIHFGSVMHHGIVHTPIADVPSARIEKMNYQQR